MEIVLLLVLLVRYHLDLVSLGEDVSCVQATVVSAPARVFAPNVSTDMPL